MRYAALLALAGALALGHAATAFAQATPFAPGVDVMTAPVQAGYFVHQKVVYQNDGGLPDDRAYFAGEMRNISNHLDATGGDVEIRVVAFARGVTLFTLAKTDPELAKQIDDLRARGVRFLICRNTLRGMKLRPEDLYKVPATDVVPAGVAEIARLQGQGFVYIHP